jgi:hypothetical protein
MEHYKISLSKGGVSVELSSHDKAWLEQKEGEYKAIIDTILKAPATPLSETRATTVLPKEPLPSAIPINEFFRKYVFDKKVKTRTDIATFFVYYLSKVANMAEIKPTDIKNAFKDVQYPGWNKLNINDILNKAKMKAFLNSYQGNWSLTITGENYVLNTMAETKNEGQNS